MLEEERTKRMNELEKMAKKHKKKQKYPMSIFPDYKEGAEEFNKNSTPLNQDALSSADASSGMAEDIRKNNKKGINEEMDDFLYWEMAEPQCTGYDCDSNIEYVYGDNEDRVWIEEDGKKYKVYVNQWDTKPTATFTSLKKAKAFGEKYWQDNYGYVNESLNEALEYNEDIKIDGFEFSEYENHHTGEMEVEVYYNGDWVCSCEYNGWDGLRIVDENSHYKGIINEEDVEQLDVDDFYNYCLNLKDEFEERNRSAFDPMDESLKEGFSNGTLSDFNPQDLMDKVKSRLEAINTIRTNGNMKYMISIHPHGLFARLSPETKYDVYIVSEDEGGNQEWVSSYEEFSNLLDTEVVAKLNDWKNDVLNVN